MTTEPDDLFIDPSEPSAVYDVNQTLRKSEGGLIEAVKKAVTAAMREAVMGMSMRVNGRPIYVDIEYPMSEAQYPGIWVKFSPTQLGRAGISHEFPIKEDGNWSLIQEWTFTGRISLEIVALKSKERDQLADRIIAMLAFARTPDLVITKAAEDTKQNKGLIDAINDNPFVAMTMNTDLLYPSGQNVEVGAPWQENILVYTDSYAFDCLGQFNVKFRHDGVYELARIDVIPEAVDLESITDPHAVSAWSTPTTVWRSL